MFTFVYITAGQTVHTSPRPVELPSWSVALDVARQYVDHRFCDVVHVYLNDNTWFETVTLGSLS
jgi:hypothetical protein